MSSLNPNSKNLLFFPENSKLKTNKINIFEQLCETMKTNSNENIKFDFLQNFLKFGNPKPIFNKLEFKPHKILKRLICSKDLLSSSKPTISYIQIIMEAITANNNIAMLNEIYQYFELKYPYYRNLRKENWKGSIRHNLSLCKMFKRIPKEGKKGKGGYWSFNENYIRECNSNTIDLKSSIGNIDS